MFIFDSNFDRMISVCIPVFNEDIRMLVRQLLEQAGILDFTVEILCYDDGSDEEFKFCNRELISSPVITYKEFKENRGRAAIRNEMGKAASQPWILFLDADSMLSKDDFLKNYLPVMSDADIICGGTAYMRLPPTDKSTLLRWTYGRKREQLSAAQRMKKNRFAITANNFMIRKDIFLRHPFREEIRGYGHEDTVFGFDLIHAGYKINHTDNPVLHAGLEPSSVYLKKTKDAIDNLVFISEHIISDDRFIQDSGLLRLSCQIRKRGLLPVVRFLFRRTQKWLEKNLTSRHPGLFLFDLYRIGYLCTILKKNG